MSTARNGRADGGAPEENGAPVPSGEPNKTPGDAGRAGGRPKRRAAVRLSRVDAERLARGEIASPGQALHADGPSSAGVRPRAASRPIVAKDASERRLLDERPPHFGAL
ncbi:MAG: hypothetical protein Q3979_08305 [Actinomycetaceae bacterium]|nr:hypothetical protein [Actinomycetaceae bacterium]